MDELNKDTLQSEASLETPSKKETQVETPQVSDTQSAPEEGTTEKVYAGKFKSADELEKAYKSVESKIGKKTYSEQIGEQVLSATGFTVEQLENAGYTPSQIVQAIINAEQEQGQQPKASQNYLSTEVIKKSVEETRVERLEFELQLRDFFNENPEAKEFRDEIKEFRTMPAYRGMSPQEIYDLKLKKFVNKGAQATLKKQIEKERATLNITNNSIPETRDDEAALKRFNRSKHIDDAADFVKARIFGK